MTENYHSRYDALLDAAVDAIVVICDQGLIQDFNKAAERLFGYAADEVLGSNIARLMPDPYASEHDAYIQQYLKTHQRRIIGIGREVAAKKKSGEVFPIYLSVGQIDHEEPQPRFVGIIRDLSFEKQQSRELAVAEEDARQHRERLAHVARLSAMGELATGIAHEINQPLTAISAYANGCKALLDNAEDAMQQLYEPLNKIADQAARAGDIIRKIRQFVKKEGHERVPCDGRQVIDDIRRFAELDAAAHQLAIHWQLPAEPVPVTVDAVQIQQVLLNLIRNAIDAEEAGSLKRGYIDVRCQVLNAQAVQVSVRDYGVGISDEFQYEVFNPFATTKDDGMGMGLSISQSIIRAHGGHLSFERHPGAGTTFSFTLPTTLEPSSDDSSSEVEHA